MSTPFRAGPAKGVGLILSPAFRPERISTCVSPRSPAETLRLVKTSNFLPSLVVCVTISASAESPSPLIPSFGKLSTLLRRQMIILHFALVLGRRRQSAGPTVTYTGHCLP